MFHSAPFLEFLQLAIVYFKIELLVLVGDNSTLVELVQVQNRLDNTIPIIIVSISTFSDDAINYEIFCRDCPTSQLTLSYLDSGDYTKLQTYLGVQRRDTNRMVLVRSQRSRFTREQIIVGFREFNMVMVELVAGVHLEVYSWSDSVTFNHDDFSFISRFKGPRQIFRSNDSNALMFRQQLDRWPNEPIDAVLFTTMIAPYHLVLALPGTNQLMLSSASLNIFKTIGNILNFSLKILYTNRKYCSPCMHPFPLYKYRRVSTMVDFNNNSMHSM